MDYSSRCPFPWKSGNLLVGKSGANPIEKHDKTYSHGQSKDGKAPWQGERESGRNGAYSLFQYNGLRAIENMQITVGFNSWKPKAVNCGRIRALASAPKREKDPKRRTVITGMGLVSVFGRSCVTSSSSPRSLDGSNYADNECSLNVSLGCFTVFMLN